MALSGSFADAVRILSGCAVPVTSPYTQPRQIGRRLMLHSPKSEWKRRKRKKRASLHRSSSMTVLVTTQSCKKQERCKNVHLLFRGQLAHHPPLFIFCFSPKESISFFFFLNSFFILALSVHTFFTKPEILIYSLIASTQVIIEGTLVL